MPVKQVIVVRRDLNMRKGKIAAQAAHASLKVLLDAGALYDDEDAKRHDKSLYVPLWPAAIEWLEGSFTKITLGCDSEQALLDIYNLAKENGLHVAIIRDAGHTEFKGVPTLTCLAIGPDDPERIDEVTGPETGRTTLL